MAIITGARRGELIKLRWSDINFSEQVAMLYDSKNSEPRVLPLTETVLEELQKFRQVGMGYVFNHPTYSNEFFRNFDYYWQEALKISQIGNFRFHDLRHSCASFLAKNGATLLEIADVLGHKSISMTKRYSHLCTQHKKQLINRVMNDVKVG